MMKKMTIKLLIILIISLVVLISAGCPGNGRQDNGKNSDQTNTNDKNSNNKQNSNVNRKDDPDPEDEKVVETIYEMMKKDPNLREQIKNIKLSFSDGTLTVSGSIYGEENITNFYKIVFDVKVPKSSKGDGEKTKPDQKDNLQAKADDDASSNFVIVNEVNPEGFKMFRKSPKDGQCPTGMCACGSSCITCGDPCLN